MKVLERLVLAHLRVQVISSLDPLQSAHQPRSGVEKAVIYLLLCLMWSWVMWDLCRKLSRLHSCSPCTPQSAHLQKFCDDSAVVFAISGGREVEDWWVTLWIGLGGTTCCCSRETVIDLRKKRTATQPLSILDSGGLQIPGCAHSQQTELEDQHRGCLQEGDERTLLPKKSWSFGVCSRTRLSLPVLCSMLQSAGEKQHRSRQH